MASETDSEVLERYKLTRDRLLQAIESADQTVEIQGRDGKRRRVSDPLSYLEYVERRIAHYEAKNAAAAEGRVRNLVTFNRR